MENWTSEKVFGNYPRGGRVILEVFSPLPLLSLVPVFYGLISHLVEIHRALDVLSFRILLDYGWIVSLRAEIGPQLKLILLFLMVMQLTHDAVLVIFILDVFNVVF